MPRDIQAILDELHRAIEANTTTREKSLRHVSIKAKNMRLGDVAELPYFGMVEITTWSKNGDHVLLGNSGSKVASVPAEQRLKVRREVIAAR